MGTTRSLEEKFPTFQPEDYIECKCVMITCVIDQAVWYNSRILFSVTFLLTEKNSRSIIKKNKPKKKAHRMDIINREYDQNNVGAKVRATTISSFSPLVYPIKSQGWINLAHLRNQPYNKQCYFLKDVILYRIAVLNQEKKYSNNQ